ncbi:MAG: hypothetical protein PHC50_03350 [Candidatus Cloacimonetes bacterium]|nr:hypothetical protein [Candidatus Cloacimonadota bacterium]
MAFKKPTLPSGISATDLAFSAQLAVVPSDEIFLGIGAFAAFDADTFFPDKEIAAATIEDSFILMGELAEAPGDFGSSAEALKTRNYTLPGKRTNSVSLTIAGISNLQKAYFESPQISGVPLSICVIDRERSRAVLFNGLAWTLDWSAEVDGLYNIVISSEFSGSTSQNIYIIPNIPDAE